MVQPLARSPALPRRIPLLDVSFYPSKLKSLFLFLTPVPHFFPDINRVIEFRCYFIPLLTNDTSKLLKTVHYTAIITIFIHPSAMVDLPGPSHHRHLPMQLSSIASQLPCIGRHLAKRALLRLMVNNHPSIESFRAKLGSICGSQ